MAWGRLDDRAISDGKLLALSDPAWRMWGNGLIYCQNQLTDGFIPAAAIHTFGVRARNKGGVADELCTPQLAGRAALWTKVSGGYQVHDYLDWNDSKAEILARRERDAKRKGFRAESGRKPRGRPRGHDKDSIGPTSSTEQRAKSVQAPAPPARSRELKQADEPDEGRTFRQLCVIATKELMPLRLNESDFIDELKNRAARARLDYNSTLCQKAYDAVQASARRQPA